MTRQNTAAYISVFEHFKNMLHEYSENLWVVSMMADFEVATRAAALEFFRMRQGNVRACFFHYK